MAEKYFFPTFDENAFTCPYCGVYSHMIWEDIYVSRGVSTIIPTLKVAFCGHCKNFSIWFDKKMVCPEIISVPPPNDDLNKPIKEDYNEAASIVNKSPRGATALLRLALQKLCVQLGESGKNIDNDIASLVKKGLSPQIQKSMDILRVIGNNAVHPGQIDLKDDANTAIKLFDIINLIAQQMITNPKEIDKMYSSLPPELIKAIKERDKK